VSALGPRFPRWRAPLGRLRGPITGGPAENVGCCGLGGGVGVGKVTALWGAMSLWGLCLHPSRLRVSLCPQDHSTQLSRTGTLARKGIKAAAQAAGTLG